MADFQKANVDAVMAASTAWAKGSETMGRAWFGFTQSTLEQTVSTAKAMMTAKTLKEVVDLQSDYTRTTSTVSWPRPPKMSDMTMKVANEAIQPLGDRMNAAVEKMSKPGCRLTDGRRRGRRLPSCSEGRARHPDRSGRPPNPPPRAGGRTARDEEARRPRSPGLFRGAGHAAAGSLREPI